MTVPWPELSGSSLRIYPFGTPTLMPADLKWHEWQLEMEKKVSLNTERSPCIKDEDYSVAKVDQFGDWSGDQTS